MPEERPPDREDGAPRPDGTRPMPPADAAEPHLIQPSGVPRSDDRDKEVWTGRAGVGPPRGETTQYGADWADFAPAEQRAGHWWTPIAIGTAALALLGLLGFGIAVIVQNSGGETEPPAQPPVTQATTRETRAPETTPPSSPPVVTTPPTTEPVDREVNVPALRGMPLADAMAALERSNLAYRVIRRPSDAEPDTVIDSDPPEGRLVPSDTRITLVVAEPDTGEPAPPSSTTAPGED